MGEPENKTITLHDFGGPFLLVYFFGVPIVGTLIDYSWNLAVFSVALRYSPGGKDIKTGRWKRLLYCFFATVLGLIIDCLYFMLIWHIDGNRLRWVPTMHQGFQFLTLVVPMLMIVFANTGLSRLMFKLNMKQALIVGGAMGFFTAPWLLPSMPYILGWAV